MFKGRNYHRRRFQNNSEVAKIELIHFMRLNKVIPPGENLNELKISKILENSWIYPHSLPHQKFELKLISHFQENLKIYLPKKIVLECPTPQQFIEYIGFTNLMLRLKDNDKNEEHLLNNPALYRSGTAGYMYVFYFIMNRIPSDLYRYKNPKFVIKNV
jgi:hypothetical protein